MRAAQILAAASRGPWPFLLAVSLIGWVAPLAAGSWFAVPAFCGASVWGWLAGARLGNPPAPLALAWLLMLLAMMPPLLAQPMRHLWRRSLRRRRARAIALFVAAYLAVWLPVGFALMAGAIALRAVFVAAWAPAIVLALLWQATPVKQVCVNRCHRTPPLATFGLAADLDCMRFGVVAGLWCVGACWALMLVPLAVDAGHAALMAVVAVVLFAERLARPRPAVWHVPVPVQPIARALGLVFVSRFPQGAIR